MGNHEFLGRLKEFEVADATYGFPASPIVFSKAKGSTVVDSDGRQFLDLSAGFGALSLGHNHDKFQSLLHELASSENPEIVHGMGDVFPSESKVLLIEKLVEKMPNHLEKVGLTVTGGQCVEMAVKSAILATKRSGFIVFHDSYHGVDLGLLGLTQIKKFQLPFTGWLQDNVEAVPYGCSMEVLEVARRKLELRVGGCAGVIAEPIQGRAGGIFPPKGWFEEISGWCREHHALLILDEIFTGMGRLGRITSGNDIQADIICFGKALGGGMPISACIGTADVMSCWPQSTGEALHTGTYFGHPLACRWALTVLNEISCDSFLKQVTERGAEIKTLLQSGLKSNSLVKEVRGEGLFIVIEMVKPGLGAVLFEQLLGNLVITLPAGPTGKSLILSPAYTISSQLLRKAGRKIISALDVLESCH